MAHRIDQRSGQDVTYYPATTQDATFYPTTNKIPVEEQGVGQAGSELPHTSGSGTGVQPVDTALENPAHDYGHGTNHTGLGHAGLDYNLAAETAHNHSDTQTGLHGAEPIEARVARLRAAEAATARTSTGTAHPGPEAILTGRPIPAAGVEEDHDQQGKKGLLKKIGEKLHGHH